jgi:hypothetical protein
MLRYYCNSEWISAKMKCICAYMLVFYFKRCFSGFAAIIGFMIGLSVKTPRIADGECSFRQPAAAIKILNRYSHS